METFYNELASLAYDPEPLFNEFGMGAYAVLYRRFIFIMRYVFFVTIIPVIILHVLFIYSLCECHKIEKKVCTTYNFHLAVKGDF